jgi:2-polyprenyl-3-methyl-5-hydroxy-6-metoxy-1,4-benzoquinol methylase
MPVAQPRCPICESPSKTELPSYHDWSDVRWQLVRCRACGHRYTDPVPTDAEIARMYADEYFGDGGAWVCGFWSGSYVGNEVKLRREARATLALLPGRGHRLLEIGAAGGFFLDEARAAGYDVVGIELNRTMADWGRSNLGLEIICSSFERAELKDGTFDVIVAQDVLEHVREPRDFVARVARLLKADGVFLVRGPLEQSWKDRFYLALRKWRHGGLLVINHPPYHLQGFVRRSFRHVVEVSGLSVTVFKATTHRPRVDLSSPKAIAATAIELGAYEADRATAHGDFMIGCATPTPSSSPPRELR